MIITQAKYQEPIDKAMEVFGNREKAEHWLTRWSPILGAYPTKAPDDAMDESRLSHHGECR